MNDTTRTILFIFLLSHICLLAIDINEEFSSIDQLVMRQKRQSGSFAHGMVG
jgi:hypothetical protein